LSVSVLLLLLLPVTTDGDTGHNSLELSHNSYLAHDDELAPLYGGYDPQQVTGTSPDDYLPKAEDERSSLSPSSSTTAAAAATAATATIAGQLEEAAREPDAAAEARLHEAMHGYLASELNDYAVSLLPVS